MDEDDFLLDDDDYSNGYYMMPDDDLESEEDDDSSDSIDDEYLDESNYQGKLSDIEIQLLARYDKLTKMKSDSDIVDACFLVIGSNPYHTSDSTIRSFANDICARQGKVRRLNHKFDGGPLTSSDIRAVSDENDDDTNMEINEDLVEESKLMINSFVSFLANRDLSKDSVSSRNRKQRHLAAFIIFMFTSGMYEFVVDCPSMPEIYKSQINYALRKLNEEKYKVLDEMIAEYEAAGRTEVAKTIREKGLSWFDREPAEVYGCKEYEYLGLTEKDINIYRKFRPKYTNISTSLTQDVISEYILVCVDEKKGIYVKLKDKTRGEAVIEVKKVFKDWSAKYHPENTSLVNNLIFK